MPVTSPNRVLHLPWLVPIGLTLACAGGGSPPDCAEQPPTAGEQRVCAVQGWPDREILIEVPPGEGPFPVLIAFHGGGGSKEGAFRTTCPDGRRGDPECLDRLALEQGFVTVAPDGTSAALLNLRTWNAGGGVGDHRCTSGIACETGVDDMAYFDALIDTIASLAPIDRSSVMLTGISNGGAISYRLACERSEHVAAIAPVGGGNQAVVAPGCAPGHTVPLLHVHGTADPAWRYEGGTPQTVITGQADKQHVGIEHTVIGGGEWTGWVEHNGCAGDPVHTALDDMVDDGTTTEVLRWDGCDAEVRLVRIEGGGHTWPQGWQYLPEGTVGPVAQDFSLNRMMLEFFEAHASGR